MKVHHYGFLAKSIEKSLSDFEKLGYKKFGNLIQDNERGINIQFIESYSGDLIELITPFHANSVVSNLMKKFKNQVYHICYQVDDLLATIEELKENEYLLIDPPKFAPALNCEVAFLFAQNTGIIELMNGK
ncbi:MAG: VOC family protein [Salinivirgaceae bacterium]|nr:VOC family protein [Salinivirgaceae bacterium]